MALTLTAASHVVFLELAWTPGALLQAELESLERAPHTGCTRVHLLMCMACMLQAEDRVHRIGQRAAAVTITYLLGAGTADELMWRALQRKVRVLQTTMQGAHGQPADGPGGGGAAAAGASQLSATSIAVASELMDRIGEAHADEQGGEF